MIDANLHFKVGDHVYEETGREIGILAGVTSRSLTFTSEKTLLPLKHHQYLFKRVLGEQGRTGIIIQSFLGDTITVQSNPIQKFSVVSQHIHSFNFVYSFV